jgi:hypothetical protein
MREATRAKDGLWAACCTTAGAGVLCCASMGCIPELASFEVRCRAEIAEVENRVLSIALYDATRWKAWGEYFVCDGVLATAELHGSPDTIDDFFIAYVHLHALEEGLYRVELTESGRNAVLDPGPCAMEGAKYLELRVTVPQDINEATARWRRVYHDRPRLERSSSPAMNRGHAHAQQSPRLNPGAEINRPGEAAE